LNLGFRLQSYTFIQIDKKSSFERSDAASSTRFMMHAWSLSLWQLENAIEILFINALLCVD